MRVVDQKYNEPYPQLRFSTSQLIKWRQEQGVAMVDHAMNCSSGGFLTIRHNELRDFTATVLSEVRP